MSSLNERMKAIADEIRYHLGQDETHTYSLALMPNGIYEGNLASFNRGKASVQDVHKIAVGDLTSTMEYKWLEKNQFIIDHHADPGFMVQLISLQAHSSDAFSIGYAYNGNRKLYADDVCGVCHNITTAGVHNTRTATGNCYTPNYNGIPYVTSGGDMITINSATNSAIKAGDYLIVLSVAEVE